MGAESLPRSGRDPAHAPPAFQFYPSDFLGGSVAEMTLDERGAYITLLCHAWLEGSIPGAPARLAVLLGCSAVKAKRLLAAIEGCWEATDDGRLVQPRLERERELQAAYRETRAASASAGGKARAAGARRGAGGQFVRVRWASGLNYEPAETPASDQPDDQPPTSRTLVSPPAGDQRPHQPEHQPPPAPSSSSSSSVTDTPICPQGDGEREGAPGETNGYQPRHPQTATLCTALAKARRHWRPDVSIRAATSRASLRAMDGLLRIDKRDPETILTLLEWLFGDEPEDYQPHNPARFDWRRVVKSAAALRRSWDDIADQRRASLEQDAAGATRR